MPPKTTFKLQLLDQEVSKNFNVKYRLQVVKKCFTDIEGGIRPTINVLEAMRIADRA